MTNKVYMKQLVRFLTVAMIAAASVGTASAEVLNVVAVDAQGNTLETVTVTDATVIRFASSGIEFYKTDGSGTSAGVLETTINYSGVDHLSFAYGLNKVEGLVSDGTSLALRENPVSDVLDLIGFDGNEADVYVYDLSGALKLKVSAWNGSPIGVAQLSQGVYILKVNNSTIKFIKK